MTQAKLDTNTSPVKGLEEIRRFLTGVFLNSEDSEELLRAQYDNCNIVQIKEYKDYENEPWRKMECLCLLGEMG